ncbi:D-alanyl-D-alanine carboxypeptidase/D-alanyl-D-alanine endopeptidase [Frateuria aurantia]
MASLLGILAPTLPLGAQEAGTAPVAPTRLATVVAQSGFDPSAIEAYLAQPRFEHASWGVAVESLDSGRMLYTHEAQRLMQTASTAKLFTAAAVLDQPGPDYRIPTRLLGGRVLPDGSLSGALVLQGMGDPTLGVAAGSTDWARQLARQLAGRGVRRISGDLIADDTYFSGPPYGAGWEAEDLQSWFGAATSALSVNENIADLTVEPANRVGRPAGLVLQPEKAIPQIDSHLDTGPARDGSAINLYRAPGASTLEAFGQIGLHSPAQHFRLSLPDPARTAGLLLAAALRAQGIVLQGRVVSRHWPEPGATGTTGGTVLAEILSPPLAEVLQQGLKRSQNLYLQDLLQIAGVGYAAEHPPASAGDFTSSADSGVHAIEALLQRAGIDPAAIQISDGTGMSRRSLATPLAMVQWLAWVARQPFAAAFRNGLPVAAVDGTLAAHFHDSPAADNLQAKTGSMSLVHCLVGYVTSVQGEHLAFAVMLNNYVPPTGAPSISHDVDQVALLLTLDGVPELVHSHSGPRAGEAH